MREYLGRYAFTGAWRLDLHVTPYLYVGIGWLSENRMFSIRRHLLDSTPRGPSFTIVRCARCVCVCSTNNKYYTGATIYIRAVNIERDGEQYGTYYQAVRSYREQGKMKQDVVHLGEHQTADEALTAWADDVRQLQTTRPRKAEKLRAKMDRLRAMV